MRTAHRARTVHEQIAEGCQRLRDAGIPLEEAHLDARLVAQSALGWTTERLLASPHEDEPDGFADRYHGLVSRRAAREPLAYILGQKEFWGLAMDVSPAVLIPRPETELIVEAALAVVPPDAPSPAAADVGTGSGCLAVAIARERPFAHVMATDVSAAALAVARRNAEHHGVADRMQFARGNLLDGIDGPFDLIVSNPPYVPERDRMALPPEVRDYEPAVALFAGADGLDAIVRLVEAAPSRLVPGGHLIFEFGAGQHQAVEHLIAQATRLRLIELRRDLAGIARTAIAQRV